MATKTISIDLEAYRRLNSARQANESFSQTIKRVVKPSLDVDAWLRRIRRDAPSKKMAAAVEEQVRRRRIRSRRER